MVASACIEDLWSLPELACLIAIIQADPRGINISDGVCRRDYEGGAVE